jgi:hypothetical protein
MEPPPATAASSASSPSAAPSVALRSGRRGGLARRLLAPPDAGRRTRPWMEIAAILWLLWLYDAVSNLEPVRARTALNHGWAILHLERSLHLAPELALDTWMAAHRGLALIVSDYYDIAHFVVTFGVLALLWWKRPDLYRSLRNALVLANVLAFVVFWAYPVAPPRMLAGSGFKDIVASTGAIGSTHGGSLSHIANEYAAMPSLHIAWAVWSALALWRLLGPTRRWRAAVFIYPLVTALTVLTTGNHYLSDVLAGLLTIVLTVLAADRWTGWSWSLRGRYLSPAMPASSS